MNTPEGEQVHLSPESVEKIQALWRNEQPPALDYGFRVAVVERIVRRTSWKEIVGTLVTGVAVAVTSGLASHLIGRFNEQVLSLPLAGILVIAFWLLLADHDTV